MGFSTSQICHENKLISKGQRVIISDESYSKSKAQNLSFSLNTIDLHLRPLDIEDGLDSPSSTSPISIPPSLATKSSFSFCNELNSYFVQNADCAKTLNTLNDILSHYKDEIEFEMDAASKKIDGFVFLSNICVYFTIYVWSEDTKHSRLEFRRTSGDSLAAANFWSEIKALFDQQSCATNDYENEIKFGFFPLDLDMCAFESEDDMQQFDVSALNELTQTLIENSLYVVDELTFLYQEIRKNEQICRDIVSHHEFMRQLVNECTQNKDVCVVRIALMILEQLAMTTCDDMINMAEIELFYNIDLMLEHKQRLIRKCAMRLLANVCANTQSDLTMNDELRASIVQKIKECASESDKDVMNTICSKF